MFAIYRGRHVLCVARFSHWSIRQGVFILPVTMLARHSGWTPCVVSTTRDHVEDSNNCSLYRFYFLLFAMQCSCQVTICRATNGSVLWDISWSWRIIEKSQHGNMWIEADQEQDDFGPARMLPKSGIDGGHSCSLALIVLAVVRRYESRVIPPATFKIRVIF